MIGSISGSMIGSLSSPLISSRSSFKLVLSQQQSNYQLRICCSVCASSCRTQFDCNSHRDKTLFMNSAPIESRSPKAGDSHGQETKQLVVGQDQERQIKGLAHTHTQNQRFIIPANVRTFSNNNSDEAIRLGESELSASSTLTGSTV